ncbi:aspartate aminotransferase family protein [Pseudalkalibacillus berkeleyi]|uniref:Aspartate aminotransferase family protein n=1 Tax=Pseudalkalibacillus berkeleyi TaxID=1069813 RepID=A0ABS9GWW4_9BACL|nr:aspartate aminotransferase family protein [Pseudalkalibacillus berkeleyi]MCF6137269.1 aspartate aminotransferase family protein [Pseudalkalibacillus berkeleyi]
MANKSHLIKPLLGATYPEVAYGKGIYLYDSDGNRYLDGASGAVTANIGHGVTEIIQAMKEQAEKISFVYRSQFTNRPAEELAEKLAQIAPGDLDYVFFVNSGSEAMETALKIAIQYWQEIGKPQKNRVISRWTSYHGITLGALSMSGHVLRRNRFSSLLADYPAVSPPYCYQCPFYETYPSCGMKCANELETAIQRIGPENVAAFIFEPIIGAAGGAIVPPEPYYAKIKEICDRYDVLLIADEVMTGFGRTGKNFAMEHWNVEPDIMALGKGLSGGYTPIGATMVSARIIDTIERGSKVIMSGHTLSGNPQSAAVALAVLDYMNLHQPGENAANLESFVEHELRTIASHYPVVGDIRGKGLLWGLELVTNPETKESFPIHTFVTERTVKKCFEKGLIVYPAVGGINGTSGDAIIIAPPLTISKEEMKMLMKILEEAIAEISHDLDHDGLLHHRSIS